MTPLWRIKQAMRAQLNHYGLRHGQAIWGWTTNAAGPYKRLPYVRATKASALPSMVDRNSVAAEHAMDMEAAPKTAGDDGTDLVSPSQVAHLAMGPLALNIERFKHGWRMVPREPTKQMTDWAAWASGISNHEHGSAEYFAEIYRIMFDAFQCQVTD